MPFSDIVFYVRCEYDMAYRIDQKLKVKYK